MNHFALTLNPAPFHKWDKTVVNSFYTHGGICCANYGKLPQFAQKYLLEDIYSYFKKYVPQADFSEPKFELTKLNNYHIHAHFTTKLEIEDMFFIIDSINNAFSNSQKWKALYLELTHTNSGAWHKYEKKDQYLEKLMAFKIDNNNDMDSMD